MDTTRDAKKSSRIVSFAKAFVAFEPFVRRAGKSRRTTDFDAAIRSKSAARFRARGMHGSGEKSGKYKPHVTPADPGKTQVKNSNAAGDLAKVPRLITERRAFQRDSHFWEWVTKERPALGGALNIFFSF